MARVDLNRPHDRTVEAWVYVEDDASLDGVFYPVVSLARYRAERDQLHMRVPSIGVRIDNDQSIDALKDIANEVERIELVLPTFKDGRAFTQARRLRRDAGFKGELRAVGHIIPDQASFLRRVGVTSVEVPEERVAALMRHLSMFSVVYQASADNQATAMERRHRQRGANSAKQQVTA